MRSATLRPDPKRIPVRLWRWLRRRRFAVTRSGILIAAVTCSQTWVVWDIVTYPGCYPPIQEARIELNQLQHLVNAYYLASTPRSLPCHLVEMTEGPSPLTKQIPKDPWGNDYVYQRTSDREFLLYSAGPDGEPGTEDDIDQDFD